MAGVKGRSGRKSHYDEMLVSEVVNSSIKLVREYINDLGISLEKRVEVAKHFGLKAVPTSFEGDFSGEVVVMPMIEKDGKPLDYNVGS